MQQIPSSASISSSASGTENKLHPKIEEKIPNDNDDDDESDLENDSEDVEGSIGDGEILHCTFPGCSKEFSSRWSLTRHIRTHTGERYVMFS